MNATDLASLNARFALPGHVAFQAGPGGLPVAEIANARGAATIALHGAHVLSFQPRNEKPVLWLSPRSFFEAGKPIRGGIPVCWPWFGDDPANATKLKHGFARSVAWTVLGTRALPGGETEIRFGLADTAATRALWPHAFEVEFRAVVGARLDVALAIRNPGPAPFSCTQALHTYFAVSDIRRAAVNGLEGCPYLDTVGGRAQKPGEKNPIVFQGETDRVYTGATADCVIHDPGLNRRIRIAKSGSRSTVVWNPWIEKCARLDDMPHDGYRTMLCVETTNALDDGVTVPSGREHALKATITVEPYLPKIRYHRFAGGDEESRDAYKCTQLTGNELKVVLDDLKRQEEKLRREEESES